MHWHLSAEFAVTGKAYVVAVLYEWKLKRNFRGATSQAKLQTEEISVYLLCEGWFNFYYFAIVAFYFSNEKPGLQ